MAERTHLFRAAEKKGPKKRINLDELGEDAEEAVRHSSSISFPSHRLRHYLLPQEKEDEERSEVGSQAAEEDYDVEEEYDNDYAENYFDNGEGDDVDGLGDGGGDEAFGSGGGGTYLSTLCP